MTPWNREHMLLIAAGLCLFALFFDRMALTPLIAHWDANTKQIAQLRQDLDKGDMLLLRENSLKTQWKEMQTESLPKEVSVAENHVFSAVDRWVDDSRIALSSFKPQWRTLNDNAKIIECRAVAQGSLEEIARFLYELERDPLALKIDQLEITGSDERGQVLTLNLRFSGLSLLYDES